MRPQLMQSELSIRVSRECETDYCGDIEERLTLFKCACARLILPHEPRYLDALEAAETAVLRGYHAYERRSLVDNPSINLHSVTEGLSTEIPGAVAVFALDRAIGEPGPASYPSGVAISSDLAARWGSSIGPRRLELFSDSHSG